MAISTKAMPSAYVAPNRYHTTATPSKDNTMRRAAGTQNSNFGFIRNGLYKQALLQALFFRQHVANAAHRLDQAFRLLQGFAQAQYVDIDRALLDHHMVA